MSGLKIWLLQTWEPNPLDDPSARPWRTGLLALKLEERGHEVTWWASNFSHTSKRFRQETPGVTEVTPNFKIRTIPALGYRRHVSLQRLQDHRHVATEWRKLAESSEMPDLIVASYPTIETCAEAARYARAHDVPLLIDIRDQYPDLYWENAPGMMRPIVKAMTGSARRLAREALAGAVGITANGPEVVQWGLRYAGRPAGAYDRSLFMSYEPPKVSAEDQARAEKYWAETLPGDRFIVAYTGMIGQTIELAPIFEVAPRLPEVTFVFCGGGDGLVAAEQEVTKRGLTNVLFTGWLKTPEIQRVLQIADVGLVPYRDRANFETGVTNKPVEYLANGLPILTSLQRGVLVDLLRSSGAGATYKNSDPQGLEQILRQWSSHPDHSMPERARQLFKDNFHPELVYGEWVRLIEEVAGR